jgi:ubiquinone/menaquinone biosynthesis C-methylase UbiE
MYESNTDINTVTGTSSQIKLAYDRMSRFYDVFAGKAEKKLSETGLRLLDIKPGDRVLEIGFGTGNGLVSIARQVGEAGKAYGLDISTGMLAVAQAKLDRRHLTTRVEFSTGDARQLRFSDGAFDTIFMSFTLELFNTAEIPVVLRECRRVLRHNGRVSVVGMSKKGKGMMLSLYEWAHRRFPTYIDCQPIRLTETLEASGFRVMESRIVKMWGLPVEIALAGAKENENIDF